MRALVTVALVCLASLVGGCATPDRYTTTQLDALQARVVEAGPDAAYSAACGAVMDQGFIVDVEDAKLRILSATRRRDPSVAEHAAVMTATAVLTLGHAMFPAPPSFKSVGLQVLPAGNGRSMVRIRTFYNGVAQHDPAIIEELWVLTERRLLGTVAGGMTGPNSAPSVNR